MKCFNWPMGLAVLLLFVWPACGDSKGESTYINVEATPALTPFTFVGDEVLVGIGLEDASIVCADETAQLRIELREPLPPNAQLNIQASRQAPTTSPDTQEFTPVGETTRLTLDAGYATRIAISLPEIDGLDAADIAGVYFTAIGSDGVNLQSQIMPIPASDARC